MINQKLIDILIKKINLDYDYIQPQNTLISCKCDYISFKRQNFCIDTVEVNQLYRISQNLKDSNINLIISIDKLFTTKYDPVILYEYYQALIPSGYLVIILRKNVDSIFLGSYKQLFNLVTKIPISEDRNLHCFCFQKVSPAILPKEDSIKKWTFGYITNGTKNSFIDAQIQRIQQLCLENWEVIICGKYESSIVSDNVKYIPFTEKNDKGWITKKKNLICENAQYENLVILHDRYMIPLNFLEEMEKWGNNFHLLGVKQIYKPSVFDSEPIRCQDWMTYTRPLETEKKARSCSDIGILDPRDFDKWCYITGGVYIVKRSLMLQVPQDESLFWNDVEDIKFCHDFTKAGYLIRFNPKLEFESTSYRWPPLVSQYLYNPYKLGKKTTSKETLLYWYFVLLDTLLLSKEIELSINEFRESFSANVDTNEPKNLDKISLLRVKNFKTLNNWCKSILLQPSICKNTDGMQTTAQVQISFNLVIGRSPSSYEEFVWLQKKYTFSQMVSDLVTGKEFQYKIRSVARLKYKTNFKDAVIIKFISLLKPIISTVLWILINFISSSKNRLIFIKRIVKKLIF